MERREMLKGAASMAMALGVATEAAAQDGGITPETVYELRVYHLNAGTQPKILERFRTKERAIFERHGMHPIAYWTALDGPAIEEPGGHTLIYIVRHRSRAAADKSWDAFRADPEWIALKAESEKDGPFVAKQEHTFMQLTDFSPKL